MSDVRSGAGRVEARRGGGVPRGQLPRTLLVPAVLALLVVALPVAAIAAAVDWANVWDDLIDSASLVLLWQAVRTALVATAVCLILGAPLAFVIARASRGVAAVLRTVVLLPLLLPPTLALVAVALAMSPDGVLAAIGVGGLPPIAQSAAVVLVQAFVALPFLVLATEAPLRGAGAGLEFAAAELGAGRWRIFWRVLFPIALPGLILGVVLAFVRAVAEAGTPAILTASASSQGGAGTVWSIALTLIALAALLVTQLRRSPDARAGERS